MLTKRGLLWNLNISLKEGIKLSKDKKHYILMDVREEERYKEGHLENAISCPYGILKECYEQMDGKKIIVYCDFGGQSMMAARHLRKDGFEVYNIIWKKKNKISQRLSMLQKLTVDEK